MNPKKLIGSAAFETTSQAFGSELLTIISPRTRPTIGLPPNTLNADQQIKAGKNAKAVSVNTTVYV